MDRHPFRFRCRSALPVSWTLAVGAALVCGGAVRPVAAAEAPEIVESTSSYQSQGKTIAVERFEPKAAGTYPVVLVLHGAGGMTIGGPWFREAARKLARRGYVAHVVHYFDRTGTTIADEATMKAKFPVWLQAVADGITNAAKQPNADARRVGLLGFSLGSYLSISLSAYDPRVQAVVEYFGGLPDVLAKDARTLPPVLILHGDADPVVPVSEARELEAFCARKGVTHEVRIYKGQGHGFFGDDGLDASRRALAFLDAHVKNADPTRKRETAPVPMPEAIADAVEEASGGGD